MVDANAWLDRHPAVVERVWRRHRDALAAAPDRRRRWLTAVVWAWLLTELVAPRRHVAAVTRLLVVMVFADSVATYVWITTGIAGEGNPLLAAAMERVGVEVVLVLRTLWSVALALALGWLAERRAIGRLALVIPLAALGAVTVLHAAILGTAWGTLLGG